MVNRHDGCVRWHCEGVARGCVLRSVGGIVVTYHHWPWINKKNVNKRRGKRMFFAGEKRKSKKMGGEVDGCEASIREELVILSPCLSSLGWRHF